MPEAADTTPEPTLGAPASDSGSTPSSDADRDGGATSDAHRPDIDEDGAWVEADAVEIRQGAVGRVDATEVSVLQGAIGAAKSDRIDVHMGAVGAALGGHVSVAQGVAGTVLAQQARVEQSFVRTLVAQEVTVTQPSAVVFLIAQRVSGQVKVLLDWRGAIAFGAAFGIVAGLVGRARGRR